MKTIVLQQRNNGNIVLDGIILKLPQIMEMFDRNIVIIEDQNGYNVTKEFLMKTAFKNEHVAYNYLYYTLGPSKLIDIITDGGAQAIIDRSLRGEE